MDITWISFFLELSGYCAGQNLLGLCHKVTHICLKWWEQQEPMQFDPWWGILQGTSECTRRTDLIYSVRNLSIIINLDGPSPPMCHIYGQCPSSRFLSQRFQVGNASIIKLVCNSYIVSPKMYSTVVILLLLYDHTIVSSDGYCLNVSSDVSPVKFFLNKVQSHKAATKYLYSEFQNPLLIVANIFCAQVHTFW